MYPVWRARNLPFGRGVLSLAQRGEAALEMYTQGETPDLVPVERFEGHTDVVKEFVWRKGGQGSLIIIFSFFSVVGGFLCYLPVRRVPVDHLV